MGFPVVPFFLAVAAATPATTERPIAKTQAAWFESRGAATAIGPSIDVPKWAGSMSRLEVRDLGSDGVDLVAQYASADEQIFGTIFIYKPTLPHSGLTFLATDEAIRRRLDAKIIDDQPIAIGGVATAGRRVIYSSSDVRLGSSGLIIVRASGWMLKLRVSGPADRGAEIAANLDALAAGLRFGKGSEPLPTHMIHSEPCKSSLPAANAALVKPHGTVAIAQTLMAVPAFVDENGRAVADFTVRVPDRLCLAESTWDGKIPLLTFRTVKSASDGMFEPKIFQLYGDAGQMIEVTRSTNGTGELYALRHGIGRLIIYGGFATEPSVDQLTLIRRSSRELPVIAVIHAYGGGNTKTDLFCDAFAEGCETEK